MSEKSLQEMIAEDKQKRETECLAAINATLKAHNCQLVPFAIVKHNQVQCSVEVAAL